MEGKEMSTAQEDQHRKRSLSVTDFYFSYSWFGLTVFSSLNYMVLWKYDMVLSQKNHYVSRNNRSCQFYQFMKWIRFAWLPSTITIIDIVNFCKCIMTYQDKLCFFNIWVFRKQLIVIVGAEVLLSGEVQHQAPLHHYKWPDQPNY